jgi:ABC-type sugar transport system substrate-binding protein
VGYWFVQLLLWQHLAQADGRFLYQVAEKAKQAGYIKDYLIQNGDGYFNAQIAQINAFILQGVE